MITHEIKHPEPPTLFQQVASHFRGRPQQQQHRHTSIETYWGKLPFTKWLEEEIRPKWAKGTLCSLKAVVAKDVIPMPLFEVAELQEVHWMAPVADVTNEPRAILLKGRSAANYTAYPPGLLRKLTEKELELVRLRDQTPPIPKQPDTVGVTPDGEFVRKSGEDGEIVERYSG